MRVMVVLAHFSPGSFNTAIAAAARAALERNDHEIYFHDLYREGFDPLMRESENRRDAALSPELRVHCDELRRAGGLVVVHPNWWGQPPAILKGWIDRVIRAGVAYEFIGADMGEGVPAGLLAGKTGLVFNTSDTPQERERSVFGDPLELIWKKCIFEFCGITRHHRVMYNVVVTSTPAQRAAWLADVERIIDEYFPAAPPEGGG